MLTDITAFGVLVPRELLAEKCFILFLSTKKGGPRVMYECNQFNSTRFEDALGRGSKRLSQVKRNCPGQESKPGWHRVAPKMKGVGLGGLLQVL